MQQRTKFITYLSPAKLNLGLKIVGKREDGYHLLKTIFCLIDLFDTIDIQITDSGKISLIEHNQAWPYTADLAYKAAQLLQQTTGTQFGANIRIKKTIPCGAGLGGGSSNAATILIALNHLWHLNITKEQLIELGRKLGADVPFFIHGKSAFASGIGDEFADVTIPEFYFVLVKPKLHISTKEIFTHVTIKDADNHDVITTSHLLTNMENDLQGVAVRLYPELKEIIADLSGLGKPIMTGSGSVIFLHFTSPSNANKVAQLIGKRYNTYLVKSLHVSPLFIQEY